LGEKLFPVWCEADVWSLFAEKFNINVRALVPYCVGIGSLGQASTLRAGRAAALKIEKRENRRLFAGFFVKDILWRRFIQRLFVLPFVGKCQKMNRVFSGLNDFDT
jgi:glycosyl transferase family 25